VNEVSHRTVVSVVDDLAQELEISGVANPRGTASEIVAALLDVARSWPIMNREATIDDDVVTRAHAAVKKLAQGAPFAYAVGIAAFRHLNLAVDSRVLIPRPETELLVGKVLDRMKVALGETSWGTAIDVGTGSGAIALALANEGRFDTVIGTDASRDALDVARANAERLAAKLRSKVEFRRGSLLSPVIQAKASAIVSNPPYIAFSEAEALPASVRDWEPPIALFSAQNGMAATAGFVRDAVGCLKQNGLLAFEVDERRASLVANMLEKNGSYRDISVGLDLTGRERFVFALRN
jgi:release factor glutamine methyltransferase